MKVAAAVGTLSQMLSIIHRHRRSCPYIRVCRVLLRFRHNYTDVAQLKAQTTSADSVTPFENDVIIVQPF